MSDNFCNVSTQKHQEYFFLVYLQVRYICKLPNLSTVIYGIDSTLHVFLSSVYSLSHYWIIGSLELYLKLCFGRLYGTKVEFI